MAKVFGILYIHLDCENVIRLKEFDNYKENEYYPDSGWMYPPSRKMYSKPKSIYVVLTPIQIQPIVQQDGTFLWGYAVEHRIKYGFNGRSKEAHIRATGKYVESEVCNGGIAWLTETEIEMLKGPEAVENFFTLFGEVVREADMQ